MTRPWGAAVVPSLPVMANGGRRPTEVDDDGAGGKRRVVFGGGVSAVVQFRCPDSGVGADVRLVVALTGTAGCCRRRRGSSSVAVQIKTPPGVAWSQVSEVNSSRCQQQLRRRRR